MREVLAARTPSLLGLGSGALAGRLAEALLELAPSGLDRVFFCNSGSEAVEAALRFARRATGRQRVVGLRGGYHGWTAGGDSLTSVEPDDVAAVEAELAGREVAALLFEPIQGRGLREPAPEFLRAVEGLCRRTGTLLVADEVMTGLGRTGRFFACEHSGVRPDLVLVSKALSGGLVPVGAVLMAAGVHDAVMGSAARAGSLFSTFGGNDLAMAAGLAVLEVIRREDLVARAGALGARLADGLEAMRSHHRLLGAPRGRGLMVGVAIDPAGELDRAVASLAPGLIALRVVSDLAARHQILALPAGCGADVVRLLPPAIVEESEISRVLESLDEVLSRLHGFVGAVAGLVGSVAGRVATARKRPTTRTATSS